MTAIKITNYIQLLNMMQIKHQHFGDNNEKNDIKYVHCICSPMNSNKCFLSKMLHINSNRLIALNFLNFARSTLAMLLYILIVFA